MAGEYRREMPVGLPGRSSRFKQWGLVSLVFGLVLICYWPALQGKLLWDDRAHVTQPDLRSWTGLGRIWGELRATQQYYPVLHSAFWIEHRLWGDATLGYHLVNILLHATSACLLALILRRLWSASTIGRTSPGDAPSSMMPAGTEWFAALLFAVHPMCVESVAWISEQKNTLSLFFYLLAGWIYLDFENSRRPRTYSTALLLFLLALGTKSVTATLPAALLVILWWKNGRLFWRRDIVPLVPWFFLAITAGLFTAWVERAVIGAEGAHFDLSVLQRVMLAGRIIWFYVGKLIWPVDLAFFYPHWDVRSVGVGWLGYVGAAVAVTVGLWVSRKRSRGLLAGWLLFVGSLFPALGFFNVFPFIFSYVADHFQYLASLGLIATASGAGALALMRTPVWIGRSGRVLAGAVVIILAFMANRQSRLYRDDETLFRATITQTPDSWMAHHVLGFALAKTPANRDEAVRQFRAALHLNPDFPDSHLGLAVELSRQPGGQSEAIVHYERALELRPHYAEAHNDLAVELARLPGRMADALTHFEQAIQLKPNFAEAQANYADALAKTPDRKTEALAHYETALRIRPDYAEAHNHLAYELAQLRGRLPEALMHYEEALRLNPTYAEAHHNLANTLAVIPGRGSEAVAHYEEALRLDPDSAGTHYNLANMLAHQGRLPEALSHYEAALRIKPDLADAHVNLANVLSSMGGRETAAIAEYEAALRINPTLASVHYNLALQLSRIPERQTEAISHGEEALRLKPDYVEAHNGLAIVYAQQGRLDEAKAHWEKALQINPNFETARQNLSLLERMKRP